MATQGCDTLSSFCLPDSDLIQAESVRSNKFISVIAPFHVADLASAVNTLNKRISVDIPKF